MPPITARQRQIMAVALDIIAEQGREALTIKNIAGRVGFRDAAVYRHFRCKSAILAAIADRFAENSQTILQQIAAAHQRLLSAILSAGQKSGTIRPLPVDHLFLFIMGGLRLMVTRWLASQRSFDLVAAGRQLWSSLAQLIALPA